MHAKAIAGLGAIALTAAVLLAPPSSRAVTASAQAELSEPDLARMSRGALVRVGSPVRGRDTVAMPLEVYVAQVLSAEGEPNAADAAEQALAVAVRTYALFNAGRHQKDGYDVCDTTHCQVLRPSSAATRRAAQATAGLVLTYEGAPADLYYSASCGGRTERASDVWPKSSLPYLESIEDDVHDADTPWTFERTLDEIREALARSGVRGRRLEDVIVETRTGSGRVGRVGLPGLDPDTMNSNDFRLAVGSTELRSTAFTMTRSGDRLTFVGRGYGHGVGMCVIGAGRRANRGESAAQILAAYYPGLALEDVSRVLPEVAPRESSPLPSPTGSAPPALPALPAPKASAPIRVRVPSGSRVTAAELERLAGRAQAELTTRLGVQAAPLTLQLHGSVDAFRRATGQPWWVSTLVRGASIDLAPAAVLDLRDGLDRAVRSAVAEALVAPLLQDRPAWVRVGASRYFAKGPPTPVTSEGRIHCPADAELTAATSAAGQREAEARAESCFAQALVKAQDWRMVH